MKYFLAITFILCSISSFGQTQMFWNNYSNVNPAMSAFQYSQHGALSVQELWGGYSGLDAVSANYNQRFAGRHGVGLNYDGAYEFLITNSLSANYNYQLPLTRVSRISLGVSAGAGRNHYKEKYDPIFNPLPEPYTYFSSTIGAAYSWKKLVVGVSTTNLFPSEDPVLSSYSGYTVGMHAHASYDFKLGSNFELTPRMIYNTFNGFQQLRFNLTASYKNQFVLGISTTNRDNFGFNVGWDIKEKFRVAYMFSKTFSKLNNSGFNSGIQHELTLGYYVKHKRFKQRPYAPPNF